MKKDTQAKGSSTFKFDCSLQHVHIINCFNRRDGYGRPHGAAVGGSGFARSDRDPRDHRERDYRPPALDKRGYGHGPTAASYSGSHYGDFEPPPNHPRGMQGSGYADWRGNKDREYRREFTDRRPPLPPPNGS